MDTSLLPENVRCPKCREHMIAPDIVRCGHMMCVRCAFHSGAQILGCSSCSRKGPIPFFFSEVAEPPSHTREILVSCDSTRKKRKRKRKRKRSVHSPPRVECFDCQASVLVGRFDRHKKDWCPKRLLQCVTEGCTAWMAAKVFTEDPRELWVDHKCPGVFVCRMCIAPSYFSASSWQMKTHLKLAHPNMRCSERLNTDPVAEGEDLGAMMTTTK